MKLFSVLGRSALILLSACLALACSKLAAGTNPTVTNPAPSPAVAAAPPAQNPEDLMPRVKVEEAKKLMEDGKAIIIDVRGTSSYQASHLKGSIDYPLAKIEAGDFNGLPKDKRIIAYCS